MYYSDDVLRQVREGNDIVSVVSSYITLTKKGNNYFGLCPFHGEKTASFSVNEREQFYHCFGCGAGGNVFTFLMQMDNMSFSEAVKELAERAHITLPEVELTPKEKEEMIARDRMREAATEAARYYYTQLAKSEEGGIARGYLKKRGITDEYAVKFGLGYAPVSRNGLISYLHSKGYQNKELLDAGLLSGSQSDPYDRFFNRLMFPIFDAGGRVIGFSGRILGDGEPKYLNSPESEIFNKGRNLYMMNLAKKSKRGYVLLVEGNVDVLSLHQAGFDNAVASLGTALTKQQCLLIKRYFPEAVICYDSDKAGIAAARRAIPLLEEAGLKCRVCRVEGGKDPDEIIKTGGPEAFEKVLAAALNPVDFEYAVLTAQMGETVEGKVKVVEGMVDRLAKINSDLERELHIKDVAAKMRVTEAALEKAVREKRENAGIAGYYQTYSKREDAENETKAERFLLSALIQKPELFDLVAAQLGKDFTVDLFLSRTAPTKDQPEGKINIFRVIAEYVFSEHEKGRAPKSADIITQMPEAEAQERVSSLIYQELPETAPEMSSYLSQNLRILLKRKLEAELRDTDDLAVIQKSIKRKKEIQDLWITI